MVKKKPSWENNKTPQLWHNFLIISGIINKKKKKSAGTGRGSTVGRRRHGLNANTDVAGPM